MKTTCPTCNKKHSRTSIADFCSLQCKRDYRITWIGFVVANHKTMRPAEMRDHIGIIERTFRTWIFNFNVMLKGYVFMKFPKGKPPVMTDGKTPQRRYEQKKQAERNALGITKSGNPKPSKTTTMRKATKRDDKLPDRVIDASKLKSVRINPATTVLVNIDVPDDVAIANYLKRREESQNYHCYNKSA